MRSPGCEELLLAPEERGRIDSQVKEKIANPRWYTRGIPGYWFTGKMEPCLNRTRPNTGLIYHNKILHVSVLKTLYIMFIYHNSLYLIHISWRKSLRFYLQNTVRRFVMQTFQGFSQGIPEHISWARLHGICNPGL